MNLVSLIEQLGQIIVQNKGNVIAEVIAALGLAQQIQNAHGNIDIGLVPINGPADLVKDVGELAILLKAAGVNVTTAPLAITVLGAVTGFDNIMNELRGGQAVTAGSFKTSELPDSEKLFGFDDTLDVYVCRRTAAPNGVQPVPLTDPTTGAHI